MCGDDAVDTRTKHDDAAAADDYDVHGDSADH